MLTKIQSLLALFISSVTIGATLVASSSASHSQTETGIYIRLESTNFPTRYIRHRNSQGFIEPTNSNLDTLDSTFRVRYGLAGSNCYSLESKNLPNHFLRHQNFRIVLSSNNGSTLFEKDATFCPRTGLIATGISLESYNFPGHYIRHKNFELWLDKSDGSQLFKKDASFYNISQSYKESAWEAYWNGCGRGIMSREDFTRTWRPIFERQWNKIGARPQACG